MAQDSVRLNVRPKVYVTRCIPQRGVDTLLQDCNVSLWDSEESVPRGELLLNVMGVDGILCMPSDQIDAQVLDAAGPSLRAVATMSGASTHIDVEECKRRGITVMTCPGQSREGLADLTLALVNLTLDSTTEALDNCNNCYMEHGKSKPGGMKNLQNKTFGIYGLTDLGLGVANRLKELGVTSILSANYLYNKHTTDIDVEIVSWPELLQRSDILCNCAQHDNNPPQTFSRDVFKQMKRSAIIVDCQNSNAVCYVDLYEALRDGDIAAAGINDCNQEPVPFRYPLSGLHNCVFLPPTKESTFDVRHKQSVAVARNLKDSLRSAVPVIDY